MKIKDILSEIDRAYPFDIFPDTTQAERDPIIKQYPGFIDRTSAMMGRHLLNVISDKLSQIDDESPEMDLISELALALECASITNAQGKGWSPTSPFQEKINGLLQKAGRPRLHFVPTCECETCKAARK